MIVAISSMVFLGCQGCTQVTPAKSEPVAGEIDYRLGQAGSDKPAPKLEASTNFSFSQGQTDDAASLSLMPLDRAAAPRSFDVASVKASSSNRLRASNALGIGDFARGRAAAAIVRPVRQVSDFDAEVAFSAPMETTGLGFDVGVVPRVSVSKDGMFKQRSVGGELRIGQNFDKRGMDAYAGSWYLFAGADGEALVYEPDGERNISNRMALRDQVTVGDMQAGVSFTQGNGQLSLSYIHREVEYNERGLKGQRAAEDFAGVSFTLRR